MKLSHYLYHYNKIRSSHLEFINDMVVHKYTLSCPKLSLRSPEKRP